MRLPLLTNHSQMPESVFRGSEGRKLLEWPNPSRTQRCLVARALDRLFAGGPAPPRHSLAATQDDA